MTLQNNSSININDLLIYVIDQNNTSDLDLKINSLIKYLKFQS